RILQRGLAQSITTFDQQISMGAQFFPRVLTPFDNRDSQLACQTDTGNVIAPARGNASKILAVFDESDPRGGTPTSDAVRTAALYLTQKRGVARTIVLATDGAPNCNGDLDALTCVCTSADPCSNSPTRGRFSCLDSTRTVGTIRDIAQNQKIPVYVIGIGGNEEPQFLEALDDMAQAGGRARSTQPYYYSVQSRSDLDAALQTIRD